MIKKSKKSAKLGPDRLLFRTIIWLSNVVHQTPRPVHDGKNSGVFRKTVERNFYFFCCFTENSGNFFCRSHLHHRTLGQPYSCKFPDGATLLSLTWHVKDDVTWRVIPCHMIAIYGSAMQGPRNGSNSRQKEASAVDANQWPVKFAGILVVCLLGVTFVGQAGMNEHLRLSSFAGACLFSSSSNWLNCIVSYDGAGVKGK